MPDYSKLPDYMQSGMKLYIERGVLPGSFLQAVISNKLVESFAQADDVNTHRLRDYADFLYNQAPLGSWGSEKAMIAWCKEIRK